MRRRRLRSMLRRRPSAFWAATLLLAGSTGLFVTRLVASVEAEAARYGSPRLVPVVVRAVAAGEVVEAGDLERRRVPAAFVPAGEVADRPAGRAAAVPLVVGEVVLQSKLAPSGMRGAAALLPPGTRALAVPTGPGGHPPLHRLDRVDLLATFDVSDPWRPSGAPTFAVATAALVLDVDAGTVTVAVSAEEAPRLAFAMAHGSVTLALTAG